MYHKKKKKRHIHLPNLPLSMQGDQCTMQMPSEKRLGAECSTWYTVMKVCKHGVKA